LLLLDSTLPHRVLPSIATIWPSVISCNIMIEINKHFLNFGGLKATKMVLNRSYQGIPDEPSRNFANQCRLILPNRAIATKSSTLRISAQMAMTTTGING
jgi:hypothetical protein